ncbi:equisetin synthetase [Stachybotrys elegans]|uniref:Equisetin synthetase n=1 Tax=Stachybotrys elegans TaxID=80388 RepID=A0A8K0WTV1_9HYPO|nr:equisetin synthetase [Stachybotrys elegans]
MTSESRQATASEPIAVVGTACRFPGGCNTPSKLWDLLKAPRDVLKRIPPERFNIDAFYHTDPTHHGTTNVQHSYLLDEDLARFDASFFNIPPKEAESIDPQQRLLMETVYDSLCAAGLPMEDLQGSKTAVYVGMMCDDWSSMVQKDTDALPMYAGTGTARSIVSNRLSYFFDWHGPSMTIDTACSSSLVAVHEAVRVLRSHESTVAIAAGTNLILSPGQYVAESNLRMLSPTGRSRMWDASADGYARGEGVASVVLKTLSQALADGDRIECIIRETGVNQDGHTSGITVPSNVAQTNLIRDTYARAGLDLTKASDRPQFFHAHGTGTKAGDPQEAEAIHNAFFRGMGDQKDKLHVGSIKTIIGHTEGTAGLASLIGTSLALRNATIPPNLLFQNLNPDIIPFYSHLNVPVVATPWPEPLSGAVRRASINSFGFGGTNAHAILEAYVPGLTVKEQSDGAQSTPSSLVTPIVLSANSTGSLKATMTDHLNFLLQNPDVPLRDLAWTLQHRRSTLPYRKAFAGLTAADICKSIKMELEDEESSSNDMRFGNVGEPTILGIFTGQGAQWPRMGAALLESSILAQKIITHLEDSLASLPEEDRPKWSLRQELLADASSSRIGEAALSQPLCTAVQIVLVEMLKAADVQLQAVVGHSSGEIGAAYAAGLLSAGDAIRVAYYRGLHAKLAASPSGGSGAMAATGLSAEEAAQLCSRDEFAGRISVAAQNSSSSVTLSGDKDAIEAAVELLKAKGKFARLLKVDTAYHSRHMQPCAAAYRESLRACGIAARTSEDGPEWWSSVSAGTLMTPDLLDIEYWVDNMVNPVLFSSAVIAAASAMGSYNLVIEIGPHPALKGPAMDVMSECGISPPYTGLLARGKNDVLQLSTGLGFVWANLGAGSVDFGDFDRLFHGDDSPRNVIGDLPKYPFNHQNSYWFESRVSAAQRQSKESPNPVLGMRNALASTTREIQWRNLLRPKEISWMSGHRLQDQIVFPATGYVAMVLEAMHSLAAESDVAQYHIHDLVLERAITFPDDNAGVETIFNINIQESSKTRIVATFGCYSCAEGERSLTANANGAVEITLGKPSTTGLPCSSTSTNKFNLIDVGVDRFYSTLAKIGYQYSQPFQGITSIQRRHGYATGLLEDQSNSEWEDKLVVHPGVLDTALQTLFAAFSYPGDESLRSLHVPVTIKSLIVNPYFCQSGEKGPAKIPWETVVRDEAKGFIMADLALLSEDSEHTFIQIQGVSLKPLTPATARDDVTLFSNFKYLGVVPDGELAAQGDKLSTEELKVARDMERIAFYYLRKVAEMPQEDCDNALDHHKSLIAWARYTVDKVRSGTHSFVDTECLQDDEKSILALTDKHRNRVDALIIESTGQNLPSTIRAQASILEHMTKDGLLNRFYEEGIGLRVANWWIAKMAKQISHRYPHMKVLEVGAGTGGSTQAILPMLGTSFSSYTYTDVSSGFFEAAKSKFQDYAHRMDFKVFDMSKHPKNQRFEQSTYDLIVASNVLHVAEDLDKVISNVRWLLKPGGYLVNLETVTNDMLRNGIIMGGLPGWWIAAHSGRPHGPMLTLDAWDSLVQRCGFAPLETSTPIYDSLHAVAVWATQALDDRVVTLRNPTSALPSAVSESLSHLIIVGGKSLVAHAITKQIVSTLKSKFSRMDHLASIQALSSTATPGCTVLSLTELDEPFMKNVTEEKMQGLKSLWSNGRNIIWVTKGARAEEPYSYMIYGIGRVVKFEHPNVNLQFLDIDTLNKDSGDFISRALLQHQILDHYQRNGEAEDLMWSAEPEVFLQKGKLYVPRLYPNDVQNSRVNSYKRSITKDVDPKSTSLRLVASGDSTVLEEVTALEKTARCAKLAEVNSSIRIQQSLAQYVNISGVGSLMLAVGKTDGEEAVLALVDAAESPAVIHEACAISIPDSGEMGTVALISVAAHLIGRQIMARIGKGGSLLVHECDQVLKSAITSQAQKAGVEVSFLRNLIQDTVSVFVDFSAANTPSSVVARNISSLLPPYAASLKGGDFLSKHLYVRPSASVEDAASELQAAWKHASTSSISIEAFNKVELAQITKESSDHTKLTILDWTATSVPVRVRPIDHGNVFRPDRTYLLVGLSGEVGQSLCSWMVKHGARHVVLTSRKPQVDPDFTYDLANHGADVRAMPLDITSRDSLKRCLDTIKRSMPEIGGVAHGALILADSPFEDMTLDQMISVLRPKVDGSRLLDEFFYDAPLEFFIMFSSLTACLGNSGQSNYAAANMYMTSLAYQRRSRGVPGSVIDLSSLMGIGHVGRSETFDTDYFKSLGATSVSESDLHTMFAEAISSGLPSSSEEAEIVTGMTPFSTRELEATVVPYRKDLKFGHMTIEESKNLDQAAFGAAVSVRAQLKGVKSIAQAQRALTDLFTARVKKVLHMPETDEIHPSQTLVQHGVDSLVALEIRAWFVRELEVDMPVIKILGSSTIADHISDCMGKIPPSVLDVSTLSTDEAGSGDGVTASSEAIPTFNTAASDGIPQDELATKLALLSTSEMSQGNNSENTSIFSGAVSSERESSMATSPSGNATPESKDMEYTRDEVTERMSFAHTRFWFLSHALADKSTFNVALSIKLAGRLDVDRLGQALSTVAYKQEAMRTRYFWSGENNDIPTQGIMAHSLVRLEHRLIDHEDQVQGALDELRTYEWDLGSGESFRFMLLSLSDDIHWLLFGSHHITHDGVSIQLIWDDLEKAYMGHTLEPLLESSQYRTYSAMQYRLHQEGKFKNDIDFYRKMIPPSLQPMELLPFSKVATRKPQESYGCYRSDIRLGAAATATIKQLARANQSTNFHVYMAVLQALLFRLLPNTTEIFIGMADANRSDLDFAGTVGMFLNLLTVRFDRPSAKSKFSTSIKSARNKVYSSLEHSAVPLDVLLTELAIDRTGVAAPIFQVFLDYRQGTQERATFSGCKAEAHAWHHPRTGYDISLDILENNDGNTLITLQLQQSLYSQEHTDMLLRTYIHLLKAFTSDASKDVLLGAPSTWPAEDVSRALQVGKGPDRELKWPQTISHQIDTMVAQHESKPALKDGYGRALTYAEMSSRVNNIALAMIGAGVSEGDVVGVFQQPSTEWACSMLAAFRIGATYLPMDLRNSIHRLQSMVQAAKPKILLVDNATTESESQLGANIASINVNDIPTVQTNMTDNLAKSTGLAAILFTSGSTGEPKGILAKHSNLVAHNEGYSASFDGELAVVLQQAPLSFDFSICQTILALCTGGCLYIVPQEKRGDPAELTRIMREEGITHASGTPSEFEMWFKYNRADLALCKHWRATLLGGEPVSEQLIHDFRVLGIPNLRVVNNYGPCEGTISAVTGGEISYNSDVLPSPLPAGKAAPNYAIYIMDEQKQVVPVGVPGEIFIGGAGVTAGYLNLDAVTKTKFLKNPFVERGSNFERNGWTTMYRTGDRGRLDSNGSIFVEGRVDGDTQIKLRGFRIEIGEVEHAIVEASNGALSHAVVTLRQDGEKFLAAHVAFSQQHPAHGRSEFLAALQATLPLPSYSRPSIIIAVDFLPLTAHAKIDRKAVAEMPLDLAGHSLDEHTQAHRDWSPTERALEQMWRDIIPTLADRTIDLDTDFFHVGGSSLLLVQLQRMIKEEFQAAPRLNELMVASKLRDMASVVMAALSARIDWTAETAIPESWIQEFPLEDALSGPRPNAGSGLNILMTGATGYVGRFLVPHLVASDKVNKLFCLVRPERDAEQLQAASEKVVVFRADLGEPGLALSQGEREYLSNNADLILHIGANRAFWDDYEVLRPVNFEAVKELAKIALPRRIPMHFASSGSTRIYSGTREGHEIYNTEKTDMFRNMPPDDGTDGYVASKWASEKFITEVANRFKLPVTLHVPMPTPDHGPEATLAKPEPDQMVKELVGITKRLGVRPTMEGLAGWADIMPVSTLVQDISESIFSGNPDGNLAKVLHTGVQRMNWQRFIHELKTNPELEDLPTMDTLLWIGDAKRSGFSFFMPAHRLIVLGEDKSFTSRR